VVANVDGRAHLGGDEWDLLLSAQLCSPVRWHQSIALLGGLTAPSQSAERLFVELGPGSSVAAMIHRILPTVATVSVAGPDDLDRLVDAVVGDAKLHAYSVAHHGEHLYVSERVVISPAAGVFELSPELSESGLGGSELSGSGGSSSEPAVEVGTLLGLVSGTEVRSPFAGHLMGMLAQPGERVQSGQPIAWLRAS
jgi:[acyl-carrier-protein] S-malonyltransferase